MHRISGLNGPNIPFNIISQTEGFSGGKKLNKKFVFILL